MHWKMLVSLLGLSVLPVAFPSFEKNGTLTKMSPGISQVFLWAVIPG